VITPDRSTAMMIGLLRDTLADEPPNPDLDIHTGHHLNEIALHHYEWERNVSALRLLIGIRLTNLALEEQ